MKILLTGFEPFGDHPVNPSQLLVNGFPDTLNNAIKIKKAILPVDHQAGPGQLLKGWMPINRRRCWRLGWRLVGHGSLWKRWRSIG